MKILLRPHHLICLQGYKGLNYSKSQVSSWKEISKHLSTNQDTDILIISGSDDLCRKCPALISTKQSQCIENSVNKLDKKIAEIIGLVQGQTYKYSDILKKVQDNFTKAQHEQLCSGCAWWKKGLCRDSFKK